MPAVLRKFLPVAIVLMVLLAGTSCGDDNDSGTNNASATSTTANVFCQTARQAVDQFQAALGALRGPAGTPGQAQAATAGLTQAANTMIQALQTAPSAISSDAGVMAEGLRQQIASVSQPGTTAAPFPPGNQEAGNRVEQYLQANCGVSSTIVP